jgi:CubicO group peptidase (beta-lactamase class C family)
VYSDLGYLLAGAMASRAAGTPLATVVEREVAGPLGLDVAPASTWRARRPDFLQRVAPTETVPWRGGEIVGCVHDENAWILSGLELSGHAGLFGTAESVLRFGAAILDALAGRRPGWLTPDEANELVVTRAGGTLRAGFDGRASEGSSAGSRFGSRSFGHLGFTGTSLWCDPDADIVAVILTNRVSPSRENVGIRSARPLLNDALFAVADLLKGQ